ncbi:MAG: flagellar hook-length control protein FliK, partial [Treponema sp.]|nr:flagellar hook-length control protein FliK [Treponema sp.]
MCDDDNAVLYAASGEEVLFGQPVEQAADSQLAMDISTSGLEDVTESETVSDIRLNPQDVAVLASIPASKDAVGTKVMLPVRDTLDSPQFGEILENGDLPAGELLVPELAEGEFVPVMQEQAGAAGDDAGESGDFGNKFLAETKDIIDSADKAPAPAKSEIRQENRFVIQDNRSVDAKKAASAKEAPPVLKAESVRQSGNTLDITFNLNQEQGQILAAEQDILSSSNQVASGDASTFQRMLSNQLLNQAPEFVKAGSIILRDNDNGTINLNLKPESLGNVKITLHVSDKGIEGQIVVASKEAFEAFSQNMDNLRQSFRQSGFDSANLSLSLSDGSSAQGQGLAGQAGGQQRSGEDFVGSRTFGGWTD